MLFNQLLLAIKAGNIEAVMQAIKRHILFCVHYSMVYARNAYFRIKQGYFTRTRLKRINIWFVSSRLLHSLNRFDDKG